MVHPFQDESFTVAALKTSYGNVDGFFHVTTRFAAEELAYAGIKRRRQTGVLPLSPYGDFNRVYFFGRRLCAQMWACSLTSNHGFHDLAIVEFTLDDETPVAWDYNPGMDSYMAFQMASDVPATAFVAVETAGPELRNLLYDEHGNRR